MEFPMSAETIFNKHSWAALGAISPSKDFCLKAMEEYAQQEVTLALQKAKIKVVENKREGEEIYYVDTWQYTEYVDYNDGDQHEVYLSISNV